MLSAEKIVELINKLGYKTFKFDYSIYSTYILTWYNWYKGFDASFHNYKQFNGINVNELSKAQLNMGKRVCEDKASLVANENITFNIEDKEVNKLLLGDNEMTGVLGKNDFWSMLAKTVEITNALGTGAFEIVLEDLLKVNDKIVTCQDSKIKLVSHNAMNIIPLSWDNNGKIIEVAFTDQYRDKEDTVVELRIHILDENKNYKIVNKKLRVFGNNNINNCVYLDNKTVVDEFDTKSNIPWFSVFKLPIINNLALESPMGISVFGNSLDILKNIDDGFHMLSTEYRYGTKKIFYHKNLIQRNDKGEPVAPDDTNKNVFYYLGDNNNLGSGGDSNKMIQEFNPDLRIDDISKGIEASLNYLSMNCGLGTGYYKFTAGSVQKTATEVISENSSMYRDIHKTQIAVEKFILDIFKSIIYANNLVHNTKLNINAIIKIVFDASIIEDKGSIRERDLREVEKGIMSIEEYRAKYYESDRRDS